MHLSANPETKATAMLVCDDLPLRAMLADLLARQGLQVSEYASAVAAMESLAAQPSPSLVVTGLRMPGIDDWRFCHLLRSPACRAFNQVPILVVSAAFAVDEVARTAADAGADAFLPLPLDEALFGHEVRRLRHGASRPRRWQVLLVEGDEVHADLLKENFIAHGCEVDHARTGREAEQMGATRTYSAVVIDSQLADVPADRLLASLKSRQPTAVFLGMAGEARTEWAVRWMLAGGAALVFKPFSPDQLLEQWRQARRELELRTAEIQLERRARDLDAGQARLREFIERLPDGVYRSTHDGRFLEVNPAMVKILGYASKAELLAIDIKKQLYFAEADRESAALQEKLEEMAVFRLRRKDGTEIWVEDHGRHVLDEQGNVLYHEGVLRDVSARIQTEKALLEAEWKFRALFELGPIGVAYHQMMYDAAGKPVDYRFLDANASYRELTGVDPRGKTVREAFPGIEKDSFDWIGTFGQVARTGKTVRFEQYLALNGRWYDCVAYQYQPDHFVAAFLEITKRKQAEAALRGTEARHAKMVANIGDVIVIIDAAGINRYKSPNVAKWFGWQPEELVGAPALANVHPEDVPAAEEFLGRLLKDAPAFGATECRYRCRDGVYKWIKFTGVNLVHDPDIQGILGNYHDISERKQAEESMRESEEKFRSIVQSSPMAMYFYRLEGDRLLLLGGNPATDRTIGIDHQVLVGLTLEAAFPKLAGTWVPELYRQVARGELGAQKFEIAYQDERFRGDYDVHVFRTGPGSIAVAFLDITDRKQLEAQLTQAQKMESVGRLAGGVAHDFNNMLTAIQGNIALALEELPPESPLRENLEEVRKCAHRSADLTRQLLAFARKQTIAPKVLDLNATVEGMLKMLRRLIGEQIELVWCPAASLWPVKLDPSQVDQVLANLCVNARDAIPGVGKITIETANASFAEAEAVVRAGFLAGDFVVLVVSDNGCGMDREVIGHIFEPFFTTKGVGQGTGLGLATVYGIIKQNEGFIDVQSQPGQGTTFRLYLPRQVEKSTAQPREGPPAADPRGYETVLLVEDEASVLRLGKRILSRLGYTVLTAGTPGEALRLAQAHRGTIHLLITDVVMPEMNGRDLAHRVMVHYPDIKRIFMSGFTADIIASQGVLDEGVHFMQKPFTLSSLAAKVREALGEGGKVT